jgi:hypothetical protein
MAYVSIAIASLYQVFRAPIPGDAIHEFLLRQPPELSAIRAIASPIIQESAFRWRNNKRHVKAFMLLIFREMRTPNEDRAMGCNRSDIVMDDLVASKP